MKIFINILSQTHKKIGLIMSSLFFMWCISGILLIFVGFPHATRQSRFNNLAYINSSNIKHCKTLCNAPNKKIEFELYLNKPVYRITEGFKRQTVINAYSLDTIPNFTKAEAIKLVSHFTQKPISKVENIKELDSWIPWSYYRPLLPFYKCYINDRAHTDIYVSSKTGEIIQNTNRKSRWFGRIGAIPHWIYFKQLHAHAKLREITVLWLGIISLIVCITGLLLCLYRFKRNNANKIIGITVYKKWWHKWHHISGFIFGIIICSFILSGIFYVTGIPNYISAKQHGPSPMSQWNKSKTTNIDINPYNVWSQLSNKKGVRKIAWSAAMSKEVIDVYYDNYEKPKAFYLDANNKLKPISLSKDEVLNYANHIFIGTKHKVQIQNNYDYYYKKNMMLHYPLPVIKLIFTDKYNTILYVNPHSGKAITYLNNNKQARIWLTRGLHKFDFSILHKYNTLRIIILILVLLGCLFLSVTSIALSIKWFKRMTK